ncbi:MAG: transaldolase [Solirubrobacteraceae bacterium]|nr:transaldolase [Solirubrobacteraceae bacterium]
MNPTKALHGAGQSLWLDNITRTILDDGTLAGYIADLGITGLTSNPTIFEKAIEGGGAYEEQIHACHEQGLGEEETFFEIAVADLQRAADLFLPAYEASGTVDGFVSLEVSPELAYDTSSTIDQAVSLHGKAGRPNLFIKIPGTPEGLPAIEEAIYNGVPVNVTLLFSADQYLAAAEAYHKGLDRRIAEGLSPDVRSVASVFISRWDVAANDEVPEALHNKLGLAVGRDCYRAYRELLDSDRFQKIESDGGRAQRLLFASTGTKDPNASDILYVEGLAAPNTVNTMPENTLLAYADHGPADPELLSPDGGDCTAVMQEFTEAGVDLDALAARLQSEGAEAFVKSWKSLIATIASERSAIG